MKTKTSCAVIWTDHALTESTHREFKHCELNDEQTHVRVLEEYPSFRAGVIVATIVTSLARAGRINDRGFWLISWRREGLKVRMNATPLFTE